MQDLPDYRVIPGTRVRLKDVDADATGPYDKDEAKADLKRYRKQIERLQERLWAEQRQGLLIVLQALDTGGKDGTIRRVFSGVNPQGCRVSSFKQPTPDELRHDFLWRYHLQTPRRGMIGVFNRSHYEDVLVVRVHDLVPKAVWKQRYDQINAFEDMLSRNGTTIIKFYLHISKDEQKERLQSRLDTPDKHWKFDPGDLAERDCWHDYQIAFDAALSRCSTDAAPWYIVPANHKWYRDVVVARTVAETLEAMNPRFPPPAPDLDAIAIPD